MRLHSPVAAPLLDAAPCVHLEDTLPAYRIAMSLDHETGHERDPWDFEIPCARWKGAIYPHGGTRLQAWITTHRVKGALAELQAAGATPHQVGDTEATVIFEVADFNRVAAVLRPKKKRAARGRPFLAGHRKPGGLEAPGARASAGPALATRAA